MQLYTNFIQGAMCIKCNIINLSVYPDGLEPELLRVAKLLHDGKLKPGQIDAGMVQKIASQLMKGIFKGYGKDLADKKLTDSERTFLTQISNNVYVFSGFKNYQQLKETSLLLKTDEGKVKPFNEFLNDVKAVDKTYNEVYLNAEYNNAIASAQMAQTWQDYENNGIEMLTYRTVNDDRVREEHAILEGATYPIDHEFWNTYYPPNDWGCRCDVEPSTEEKAIKVSANELPDIPPMFENNVGKSGIVFPDTHPYFDVSKAEKNAIIQQVADIIPPDRSSTIHYQSDSGGLVEKEASVNKNELKENSEVAKFLADLEHKVKLLGVDDTPGVKNPDAIIEGKKFEFKTNKHDTKSSIDNELRKAKGQADHILLNIKSKITDGDLADAISNRMNRSENVESVWLMHKKRLIKMERKEFTNSAKILERLKKG